MELREALLREEEVDGTREHHTQGLGLGHEN